MNAVDAANATTHAATNTAAPSLTPLAEADLRRAAACHFAALLFLPPDEAIRDELRLTLPGLPDPLRDEATQLLDDLPAAWEAEYHALLGASGACPDCESSYDDNPLGGKGPLLLDIAGFYQAFRFPGPESLQLPPDHLAVELDFLGYLGLKAAFAEGSARGDERAVCLEAAAAFGRDHLGRFLHRFCERLAAAAGPGFHGRAAQLGERLAAA
jgi:TorA maturation chaperone TorD